MNVDYCPKLIHFYLSFSVRIIEETEGVEEAGTLLSH